MCIMYGNKITQLRKAANMTQGQLGELLNVSPQAISKWEHNLSEPDLTTMKKISTIFDISLDDFLNIESNIVGEYQDSIDADKVAATVSESVTNAVSETIQNQPKTLGYCVSCGTIVTEENLGISSPKIDFVRSFFFDLNCASFCCSKLALSAFSFSSCST